MNATAHINTCILYRLIFPPHQISHLFSFFFPFSQRIFLINHTLFSTCCYKHSPRIFRIRKQFSQMKALHLIPLFSISIRTVSHCEPPKGFMIEPLALRLRHENHKKRVHYALAHTASLAIARTSIFLSSLHSQDSC